MFVVIILISIKNLIIMLIDSGFFVRIRLINELIGIKMSDDKMINGICVFLNVMSIVKYIRLIVVKIVRFRDWKIFIVLLFLFLLFKFIFFGKFNFFILFIIFLVIV